MALVIETAIIPLESDADGIVQVGGTCVTLDAVVVAFNEGATAEEILLARHASGKAVSHASPGR